MDGIAPDEQLITTAEKRIINFLWEQIPKLSRGHYMIIRT